MNWFIHRFLKSYMSQNYIFSLWNSQSQLDIRYSVLRHVANLKRYKPIFNLYSLKVHEFLFVDSGPCPEWDTSDDCCTDSNKCDIGKGNFSFWLSGL